MKRLFVLIAAVISFGSVALAQNNIDNEYAVFSKLNQQDKLDGLAKYLEVNMDQKDYLKEIFALSTRKMARNNSNGAMASESEMNKVMTFTLANIKSVLTPEQYKKYLTVLNVTLHNMEKGNQMLAKK